MYLLICRIQRYTYTNIQFEIILKVTVRQYNCYNIDYCVKILYA